MTKQYTFRLTSEGLDEFRKDLQDAGDKGAAALKQITDATPGLAGAMDLAAQKADQARQKLEHAAEGSGKFSEATSLATETLGAFGVALSVEQVVSWGKEVFNSTALLVDQAKQLQQSTDALQAYRAAFEQSGASAEEADKAIARANQQIGDAIDNVGEARRQLSEWNLDWKDLAAAAPDQRLALIAQGLLAIEDGSRRARAEQALFGKTGHDVESVLIDLAGGVDKVIQKYDALGQITASDTAKKAKDAADQMTLAFKRLETEAAPAVVALSHELTGLLLLVDKLGSKEALSGINATVTAITGLTGNTPTFEAAKPYVVPGSAAALPPPPANSNSNLQAATDLLRQQAQYAQMTAEHQAEFDAQLALANAKLKDGLPDHALAAQYAGKQAVSQADINKILTPQQAAEAAKLGLLKAQGDELKKIKETFDQFIQQEKQGVKDAGATADQRSRDLALVEAANIVLKNRHDLNVQLVKTADDARKILTDQQVAEVEMLETEKARAQLQHDVIQPLQDEVSLAGQTKEVREQELEILKLKQQFGAAAVSQSADELRNLLKQKDAMTADDTIRDLKEQLSLAGMTADEADRQRAVLDAMHATHQHLSADQATEISQLVQARQEAERWQSVVTGITGDFQNFFQNVLTTGKLSFGSLFDAIKGEFAQLLANMAAQALIQPIIVPMVTSVLGGGPFSGVTNPASLLSGGGGGLGLAANGASLASSAGLFGGSGGFLGGETAGGFGLNLGEIGSSLGFEGSVGLPAVTNMGITVPGFSAATEGSLFGTSLSGFLGGAGLGALAGSLVFGNKNDAGIGSMGGAAAGALAGSILFPGVGTIIGGLLGGLAGGGLGSMTGSSNQGSIYNFNPGGTGGYLFKQGGGNNGQLATQAAGEVSAIVSALQAQGVTVGLGNITGLSIGSDKSYVYSANGGKQKLGGGDVDGVVSAILGQILPSATGGSADVQTVLNHYLQNGGINQGNLSQLSSDLGFANSIKDLNLSTQDLSQSEQALKAINDQYQQLIDKAQQLGLSTDQIETARQSAIQSLVQGFDDSVSSAIKQIQDPMAAAADALSAQQAQRIKDATTLGADLTNVYALNALETKQLTDAQAAQAAQQAASVAAAKQQLDDFNSNIKVGIESFTDSLQSQLDAEDYAGKQRVAQAEAIGADINAVEQYNALNRQKIINDAAAQQTAAAQQAAAAQEAAAAQTAAAAQAAAAQQQQATQAAQSSLSGLIDSLVTGDNSSLSPDQKYFLLLTRFNQANSAVLGSPTDPGAIGAFDTAATALLPVAHEFLGTSQKFGDLQNTILSTATQVGGSLADPTGLGQAMVNAQIQGSGAIVDAVGLTNDRLDQLVKNFSDLSAVVQAILNRQAA